ncbi:hypothetical protein PHYBOEH_003194 [Phytophthora boehmeriae]|uniref:BZIP domain-containing protein n=1 Tax=Phytophthora boehmeriae TaxID=109152 RepID=A0A8T1WVB5_9STRA|nr:hypothetical protein PHYBOEH_003194 [Phytophthora boehmeriae]
MALLLQDEDLEALDVALSFVDTCTASPVDSTRASLSDSAPHSETELSPAASEDDAMQLGEELNELLMSTLLPSASDMMIEFQPPTPQYVLPTPLAPLTTNISASDAAELKENGRMRGGCRAAQCRTAVPANKKPKRVKVNPNRARDERKHELAYLRNKVRQMETELGELHRRHRLGSTAGLITAIVVPQKADRCAQDATTVGAFTEFALNVIVANATVSQEMIENVLLDQALDYST